MNQASPISITYTCNLCGESIDRDSPRLDSIPTAVDESIAEARSKHRRDDLPEQEDECPGDEDGREDEANRRADRPPGVQAHFTNRVRSPTLLAL